MFKKDTLVRIAVVMMTVAVIPTFTLALSSNAKLSVSTIYTKGFSDSDRGISITPGDVSTVIDQWAQSTPSGDVSTNIAAPCWQAAGNFMRVTIDITADIADSLVVYIDHTQDAEYAAIQGNFGPKFNALVAENKVSTADLNGLLNYQAFARCVENDLAPSYYKVVRMPLRFFADTTLQLSGEPARDASTDSKWTYIGDSVGASAATVKVGNLSPWQSVAFPAWIVPGLTMPKLNGTYSGTIMFALVGQ